MATIAIVASKLSRGVHKWLWETLTETNADGAPIEFNNGGPSFSDKTVHVKGNFGSGGTVLIEGSNDGVTYVTLTDPGGTALSFTAESLETILQNPLYIRPRVSAGTGVDVDVIVCGRAILQLR